jgi:maltose alpha-D-glucosyltransferase / alpha-amylase
LGFLRRFVEEGLLGPTEQGVPIAAAPIVTNEYYFTLARQLGQRTGELHVTLCPEGQVDSAFVPEPISESDLAAWCGALRARAEATLAALVTVPEARPLLERRDELLTRIDGLVRHPVQALKTRHHGDYHLGQVLVVRDDFYIIDFEGEPMRPLHERRGKSSPLKDVAGMLRSFHYAEAAVARDMTELQPARRDSVEACASAWRREAVSAFLAGYEEATRDCPSIPREAAARRELLDLFLFDKALYEIAYELSNRPAWVSIPIAGLLELLGENHAARP